MSEGFDISTLPPETKQEMRRKFAQIDADAIAREEKALADIGAHLEEVAAAIPPAKAKADALAADAESAKHDLRTLVNQRDQLVQRGDEVARELARRRAEHAAFCSRWGLALA